MQLGMIRVWEKKLPNWELVMFLSCWELMWWCSLQSMVATPKQTLHGTPMMFIWVKSKRYLMFTSNFLLCLHQSFNITFKHFMISRELFAYMWLEIWDSLRTPNARWLAYSGLHISAWEFCRGGQLLSCSHQVDHTSIPLIPQVNLIDQRSFFGE